MIGTLLLRLFRSAEPSGKRDGAAGASGLPPSPSDDADAPGQERRNRELGLPDELLHRTLAQKVLDGWLQNRNQVLVPMTLRLDRLRADDVELLMRLAAASVLAAARPDDETRLTLRRWLRSVGAIDEATHVFDRALQAPTAVSTLLDHIQARHLEAFAYAIAVMAADLRATHGRLYADFVAARLDLPADSVRSINRRYRR